MTPQERIDKAVEFLEAHRVAEAYAVLAPEKAAVLQRPEDEAWAKITK